MKVGDPVYRGAEVPLPIEVLECIISHIGTVEDNNTQATLWACCLISRSWYAATISHLYQQPLLNNRNFDKFTRTICPPVSSHKPRVGLEGFIKRLDMGGLAYESSKSLTARLLRRTRNSLESFASPAVTFSIASLAPLGKCTNLQFLDLSADGYDMHIRQLLDSISHLDHLTTLKLPRNALRLALTLQKSHWPRNLRTLELSDWLYEELTSWAAFFESWPDNLTTLKIQECVGYGSLNALDPSTVTADTIRVLDIGISWHEDRFPLRRVLHTFPHAEVLRLPAYVAEDLARMNQTDEMLINLTSGDTLVDVDYDSLLEVLILTYPQSPGRKLPQFSTTLLERWVKKYPRLRRLEVPEKYTGLSHARAYYERLGATLEERAAPDKRASSGIFLY
ncbi:hypothetical protein EDD36DRAFT_470262 [Exophiala viscosa]|uniref:F-box domain-containing protein n=1 Tax=Exophiala viscosa TaxID=2486360 RepID=A0AAN6IJP8_9EURO|nr:hypothetical protein EDD36DRAFT_470262 [Exophiala viscosa]